MIDRDIYYQNETVEKFLQLLKTRLNKDCSTTKVYISTVGPTRHWLERFYNNTELMENEYEHK